MLPFIVFDDRDFPRENAQRIDFGPITDLRATFEIRTGVWTNWERLERDAATPAILWTPELLRDIVAERTQRTVNAAPPASTLRLINGRLVAPSALRARIWNLPAGSALVEHRSGALIAACLPTAEASSFLHSGSLPPALKVEAVMDRVLPTRPWEVLSTLAAQLTSDIMDIVARAPASCRILTSADDPWFRQHSVFPASRSMPAPVVLAADAAVFPTVILDSSAGPIFIDEHATIRPGSVIIGPAYVGPHTIITDRSLIKARTSIGPHCRIGGEVGGTIIQGYSNKSHDGHLGDSYVGEWVNFGAGTTNSNLLNTYGEVVMRLRPDGPRERTGLTFLGAVVGDHVKFAILTRIMTGTVVGTGAMIASSTPPPTTVPGFAWLTDDDRASVRSYRFDKFIEVAQTVMARRNVPLSEALCERLRTLHADAVRRRP